MELFCPVNRFKPGWEMGECFHFHHRSWQTVFESRPAYVKTRLKQTYLNTPRWTLHKTSYRHVKSDNEHQVCIKTGKIWQNGDKIPERLIAWKTRQSQCLDMVHTNKKTRASASALEWVKLPFFFHAFSPGFDEIDDRWQSKPIKTNRYHLIDWHW